MKAFATFALPIAQVFGKGGLAQLARALAWHARGHRFDSDILHEKTASAVFFCLYIISHKFPK